MGEKFGIPEMREFATAHGDQRVHLIWLRLSEARTKNALWCSETVKLRAEVERLREFRNQAQSAVDNAVYFDVLSRLKAALGNLARAEAGGAEL